MLNVISIMGRFTRDPELRHTQSQKAVASFCLAVERDYAAGGERQTDFIDCVAWGQTAEFVSKYFRKGHMATVTGRLQVRTWKDKSGTNHKAAEVVASGVYFGQAKGESKPVEVQFTELADDDGPLPF